MSKPCFLQFLNDRVDFGGIDRTISKRIAATNDFVACDLNESDGFGVSWFETDGCAGWDVKAEAVGAGAVEGEGWIGFDEVVVGADLGDRGQY